ncbi:MAG: PHB depolymerase family esterase [Candidatus Eremiobacterota bacterium]
MQNIKLTCLFLLLFSLGCHSFASNEKLQQKTFVHDGINRTYWLHIPDKYSTADTLPLVMILHGGGKSHGVEFAERTDFLLLAEKEGFIAIYPDGIDNQWNDGRGKSFRKNKDNINIDDVGFLYELINYSINNLKADPARIYLTGLSNGGMMTLRMGIEHSSTFAAIAPVIANIPVNISSSVPDSPLSVLIMNGTEDPLVPWNGGSVRVFGKKYGEVLSTEETVEYWVKYNSCNKNPSITELPDKDKNDHSTVKVSVYGGGKEGSEVILYEITGGGHSFPGSSVPDRYAIVGYKNNDITAPEIIWEFFKKHRK